jgi:two-component sensor histidine kinase
MKRPRDWPLRVHLAVFGLILLLPTIIPGAAGIAYYGMAERERLNRTGAALAADVSEQIDRELENLTVVLKTLATSPLLDGDGYREFDARARLAIAGTKTHVLLVDRSFRQLLNTRVPYGTPLPPTSDPETASAVFLHGKPRISNLFEGSVAAEPVFNVVVPVVRDGKVRYALIGTRPASSLLANARLPETGDGWMVGISDRNDMILSRSRDSGRFVGKPISADARAGTTGRSGVHRGDSLEGVEVLRAYHRSSLSGWVAAAFIPVSALEASLERTWITYVLIACGMVLLTVLLAAFVAQRVAQPIDALRRGALALGCGETVPRNVSHLREANEVSAEIVRASEELMRRERRLNLLMRELAHRTKNILALTVAIARQSGRRSTNFEDFIDRFTRRLSALGAALDLLVGSDWGGTDVEELVRVQLVPFAEVGGGRLEIGGPPVRLTADAAQQIGMALHELATNATKYGALSVPNGRVVIGWLPSPAEGMHLRLSWREVNGPPVSPPSVMGFGRTVIEQVVVSNLGARVDMAFDPEGFRWQIDLPVQAVADGEE